MPFFYETVARLTAREDDPYLAYLNGFYSKKLEEVSSGRGPESGQRAEAATLRNLQSLPEHSMFAMFMALHIYLHLHAFLNADLTVDATRLARDARYRSDVEQKIRAQTGLSVSLADVIDKQALSGADVDVSAINWDEIREHAQSRRPHAFGL